MARIDRALTRCSDKYKLKLLWLKAECHRHLNSPVSADDVYEECAKVVFAHEPTGVRDRNNIRILLEAATVAKARAQTEPQLRRAVSYLEAIRDPDAYPLRVLATLTELFALLGDRINYEKYLQSVTDYRDSHIDLLDSHLDPLEEALVRAKAHIERHHQWRGQSR